MKGVENFDIEFKYNSVMRKATCQLYKVHNYPQVRVAVERGSKPAEVIVFYDVKGENHRFFWYTLQGKKEELAKVIAKKLEKVLN